MLLGRIEMDDSCAAGLEGERDGLLGGRGLSCWEGERWSTGGCAAGWERAGLLGGRE